MLRNIDPLLSPDLLRALRAMGHGDEIVVADANFPADGLARRCIRADGCSANDIAQAILSVMPLDTSVDDPALTMLVEDDPESIPEAVADFQRIIDQVADNPAQIYGLERQAFYDRASKAYAIVSTGERRLYGNIILKKGVIG